MNGIWFDTAPVVGQGRPSRRPLGPGVSFVTTSGGRVRVRHQPAEGARLLLSADGPNVLEHYDELFARLAGRVDVTVFEPPGTGGSIPSRAFDFSLEAFARVTEEVIAARQLGPVALGLSCYLGFVAQVVAVRSPTLVSRVLLIQTPSWADMQRWVEKVDRRRLLRTPVVGQAFVRLLRPRVARGWYRASVGHSECVEPFSAVATDALRAGGCFCLASMMQGLAGGTVAPDRPTQPVSVLWGARDRTHRRSVPEAAMPGAPITLYSEAGHCPELEEPARFADQVTAWLR